jgi:hypothetical protein
MPNAKVLLRNTRKTWTTILYMEIGVTKECSGNGGVGFILGTGVPYVICKGGEGGVGRA